MARETTETGGREATKAVIPGDICISVGRPEGDCAPGWQWLALSDVARLESGHTPSRRHPEWWGGDIPWIGIKDATENHGRIINDTKENTNEDGISNSSARILPAGTVCLSRTASVGYVVVMGRPMATSQDFVNWVCGENLNNHFLKYALLSEARALKMFSTGSVHQTIYFPEAKAFHICAPSRMEQDRIVDVLLSLDAKIELNRRMNETLEAMARAIFKDWFVDFGPTRAKMAMRGKAPRDAENRGEAPHTARDKGEAPRQETVARAPYLAADIWSLFPDRLDEEGKPEGWSTGLLSDFADLNPEAWTRTSYPDVVEYVDLSNTKWGTIEAITRYEGAVAPSRAQRVLRPGDTIVGTVRPGNGSYAFVSAKGLTGSTGFAVLRPKLNIFRELVYLAATSRDNIDRLSHQADGGAYPAVRPEIVAATKAIRAPDSVFGAFSDATAILFNRIEANKSENQTLAATRDLLLPKLMSGEIRIQDAERLVGEVA